jgi:hypothetical protein
MLQLTSILIKSTPRYLPSTTRLIKALSWLSYHFAVRLEELLVVEPWHLVVMDEAHKLRNAYRPNNKMG